MPSGASISRRFHDCTRAPYRVARFRASRRPVGTRRVGRRGASLYTRRRCLSSSTSSSSGRSGRTPTSSARRRRRPRRSWSIRAAMPPRSRRALAAVGARCAAILVTHGHFDHIVSLADLAEQTGAPVYAPAGERILLEEPAAFTPPGITVRAATADVWLEGGETRRGRRASRSPSRRVPGHSPAHLAYFADGELFSGDVLFAGSVGRTDFPAATGTCSRRRSRRSSTRIRRTRSSIPATAPRRRSARSSPATRSSPSSARRGRSRERQDRAPARDPRRRPRRDAALAARHGRGRAALRALRLPQGPDARSSRTPRSSPARPGRAPTSCRRRCTASPTAPTGR